MDQSLEMSRPVMKEYTKLISPHNTTRPAALISIHSVCGVHSMAVIVAEKLDKIPALATQIRAVCGVPA